MARYWVPLLVLLWARTGELVSLGKKVTCEPNDLAKFDKEVTSIHALIIKDFALSNPFFKQRNLLNFKGASCKSMIKTLQNLTRGKFNVMLEFLLRYYKTDIVALPERQREYLWHKLSNHGYKNAIVFLELLEKLNATAKSKEIIKGKTLIATARDQKPSISITVDKQTGKLIEVSGDNFEIMSMLTSNLGFNYVTIPTFEAPSFTNGSWRGTIGMLERKEADINLQPLTIEADKFSVVDYSTPLTTVSLTLIIPYPKEARSLLASTWPFTPTVWLCFLVTMTLITLTLTFAAYMRTRNKSLSQAFSQSFLYTYGLTTCQGLECPGRTHKSRLVAGIWGITGLLFVYLYNSQLTSFLTVPQLMPLVNSIDDLARTNELDIIMMPGSTILMHLLTATSGAYKIIGDRMRSNVKQHLASNYEDGIAKVASGRYAFALNEYTGTHYGNILFKETRTCSIMIIKKPMNYVYSTLTMQKGSPYYLAINDKLRRIIDAGFINYFMKYSGNGLPRFREHCKVPIKDFLTNVKLTLSQLMSAFAVLGIGCLAALAAFILELIIVKTSGTQK